MGKRFTALRVTGTILKVLAWVVLLLGLFAATVILIMALTLENQLGITSLEVGGPLAGIAAFVVILVIALLQFLFLYALGESIYVVLSLEENSRRTAYFSQQLFNASQSAPFASAPAPAPDYEE